MTITLMTFKAAMSMPAKRLTAIGATTVVYLGGNFTEFVRLRERLPEGATVVEPGPRLNEIGHEITRDIIDLDAQTVPGAVNPLWWQASDLADRGPYATDLLAGAARYIYFMECLKDGRDRLIVVEDWWFADKVAAAARRNGFAVRFPEGRGPRRPVRMAMAAVRQGIRIARQILPRFLLDIKKQVWIRRFRRDHPAPFPALRDVDVVVFLWAGPATFPTGGPLEKDVYLGRLPTILGDAGMRVAYVALSISWVNDYRKILAGTAQASEPVFFLEDFLTLGDVIASSLKNWALFARIRRRFTAGGHDLTPVLRAELRREAATARPAFSRRFARVAERLAKAGAAPKAVVMPYENQPWEKVLRHGLRQHLKGSRSVCYFHPPSRDLYLSFLPSTRDLANDAIPDMLITLGDHAAEWFRRHGFPAERLSVGGALRYDGMLDGPPPTRDGAPTRPFTVLCATTIEYDATFDLVESTLRAMADMDDCRLIVNFHPIADRPFRDNIIAFIEKRRPETLDITYSDDRINGLIAEADVLVYNNSASCIEALTQGCPALFVHRNIGLDYDCLPDAIASRHHGGADLRRALEAARNGTLDQPAGAAARHLLRAILGDVKPDVFINAIEARQAPASTGGTAAPHPVHGSK